MKLKWLIANDKLIEYNKDFPSLDMNYIDYGLGVLSSNLFDSYEVGLAFDLSEIYTELALKSKLKGYCVTQRFYEVGSFDGLKDTELFFLDQGK